MEGQYPIPAPTAGHIAVKINVDRKVTIYCYENEVPSFVEPELERIYGNFFSTIGHFKESGRIENASTYVAIEEGCITTIFLFHRGEGYVRVLNEVIKISQQDVDLFSNFIFSAYGSVDIISFHAVDTGVVPSHRPYQRINCLEDIVLTLPTMAEDYFNKLGKSTRKTIKGYSNKIKRDFPSFKISIYAKEEAEEQLIRQIIDFNKTRMLSTGKVSAFDEEATKHIIQFVRMYGLICIATIDDKICAGSISYKVGNNYFMHVSAHDSKYDSYRLGVLFRYLTICECIKRGGAECHFLWGRQEFKFSLLGVQRDLHDLVLYRSRVRLLRQFGMALQTRFKGLKRQTELRVRTLRERASDAGAFTLRLLSRVGMLRRSA
jgi:hypothetical protein